MMTSKRISLGRLTLVYALMILSAAALFLAISHFGESRAAFA